MKRDCAIVRDLLPLYIEQISSEASAAFIKEHAAQCPQCQAVLDELQKPTPVIFDTKAEAMRSIRIKLRKRTILSILSTTLILLTLLSGIFVCTVVPVWLSVDEAIVYAQQQEDGGVKVKLADRVCHITNLGNDRFCCQGMRLDWILKAGRSQNPVQGEHTLSFKPNNKQAVWYYGKFTGESDTLLWGTDVPFTENTYYRQIDRSLLYIVCISALIGIVLLTCGIALRKKRLGKWLLSFAAFFICCALSTVFVTGGHFYDTAIWHVSMLPYSMLARRYVAIAGMTFMSFLSVICIGHTVCVYRDS